MGRGAFEHNYGALELPELRAPYAHPLPSAVACELPPAGNKPAVDLYCGDNLHLARWLQDQGRRFRLIYVDPPFNSGRAYRARVGGAHGRHSTGVHAYEDERDLDEYLEWLRPRLESCRDLLVADGTLYVHLDWHTVHYVKVLLDRIFGRQHFLNEIIWCYHGPSPITRAFSRKHDTILVYTRGRDYYFDADAVRTPYDPATVKTFQSSPKAGFGKVPNLRRGKVPEDWWYFPVVARLHGERVGYETQKPLRLLQRIVHASSASGDAVLDLFAGSGTTGVAAVASGRDAVLVDSNPVAVEKSLLRLRRLEPPPAIRLWRSADPA
ncbi:MAG TPA: site-specific DNA-methyltransferase [Herpetosiphonaceae bacterium]|nr:site-specific DNA-methyltransferase [Herpetosiphonaceae bacterium]